MSRYATKAIRPMSDFANPRLYADYLRGYGADRADFMAYLEELAQKDSQFQRGLDEESRQFDVKVGLESQELGFRKDQADKANTLNTISMLAGLGGNGASIWGTYKNAKLAERVLDLKELIADRSWESAQKFMNLITSGKTISTVSPLAQAEMAAGGFTEGSLMSLGAEAEIGSTLPTVTGAGATGATAATGTSALYSSEMAAGGLTEGSLMSVGAEAEIGAGVTAGSAPLVAYTPAVMIAAMIARDKMNPGPRDPYQLAPGEEAFYNSFTSAQTGGDLNALSAALNTNRDAWGTTGFRSISSHTPNVSWFDRLQLDQRMSKFTPDGPVDSGYMFGKSALDNDMLQFVWNDIDPRTGQNRDQRIVQSSSLQDYISGKSPISFQFADDTSGVLAKKKKAQKDYDRALQQYYSAMG